MDIALNNKLPENNEIDNYFKERFKNQNFTYTLTGRLAIQKSLQHYNLQPNDVVTILTTSNNFYISGCVTAEIEKFCKWNREISDKTKLIFVNHEFGVPYENLEELKKYKLPIIEDCAHSFFSEDDKSEIGKVGDFAIYSFPKIFPIQIGGLLVSNIETSLETDLG
jgi:dTDP-4-amino-4,6-dideoxygalactose transaminase